MAENYWIVEILGTYLDFWILILREIMPFYMCVCYKLYVFRLNFVI